MPWGSEDGASQGDEHADALVRSACPPPELQVEHQRDAAGAEQPCTLTTSSEHTARNEAPRRR